MKSLTVIGAGLFLLGNGLLPARETAAVGWPHDKSDIAPDSTVVWGTLDNGLRYAIMPHNDPPDRLSLRLYVDAGSVMEEDDQQGLAHFTEHMAFNGTKHFAAGEMVEYFQRLGMAFGADTNAHTSFKETVYKLDLPRNDDALLRQSLQLLRDYADGILFEKDEIEKERGVILSEKLSRDSVDYRTYIAKLKFNLPDSLLSERLPIGIEEAISGAPRRRFLDYYQRYYTPDRMVVVMVGAIDPGEAAKLIAEYFGSMKPAEEAAPDPDLGRITPRGVDAYFHPEQEASASWIALETMRPFSKEADGKARRASELRLYLANWILSRRLEILLKQEDSPIIYGKASSDDMLDFVTMGQVQLAAKADGWKGALALGEQELRRALEFGFTEAELAEAKANVRQSYQRKAETADTRKSRDLANLIVDTIGEERVFTNPADDLPRVAAELDTVTREEVLEAMRELWQTGSIGIFVSGNIDLENAETVLLTALEESRALPVQPPKEEEVKAFAYAGDQAPGEVVARETIDDLGITQVRFANGVRLNLKPTDFEKDTVRIKIRFGAGKLTMPKSEPGLSLFLDQTFKDGGLEAHSADEIKRIFAGTTVSADFSVSDDAFVLSGKIKPEEVTAQLQLMAAYLSAPGFREEAAAQFRRNVESIYVQLLHTPEGVYEDRVDSFIHSGDPRFGYPKEAELLQRNLEEAKAWIQPALKNGYLEISVVGDFESADQVIEAVAKTIGNLPAREEKKPAYVEERSVKFPAEPKENVFGFESELPKSMVGAFWKTADMFDIERSRRLNLLSSVFRDRMRVKIREELGEAYSPYAMNSSSDVFTGYGYLLAMAESDREKAADLAEVLREIGQDLLVNGFSEDELDRARKPILSMLAEYRRNNSYWMDSVLQSSQEYPQRLEWARTIVDDYGSATVEEVSALAKEYLGDERAVSVQILPEEAGEKKG